MDPSALQDCALFRPLGADGVRKVAAVARPRDVAAGEAIFRRGEPGDALYVVIAGSVRVSAGGAAEDGDGLVGPGGFFGETALADESPRAADATAETAGALAVIGREELEQLLFLDKDLAYDLLWSLSRALAARLRAARPT